MKKLIVICSVLLCFQLKAEAPQLTNMTSANVQGVLNDLASNLVPTNVSGASNIGDIFGFRLGVIAGITDAPEIGNLTSNSVDKLPMAGAYLKVGIPLGLSFDVTVLPLDLGDFTYSYFSAGVQWTFSDLLKLPFSLQARFNVTSAEMSWTVTDSSSTSNVSYNHSSKSVALVVGKKLLIVEPYAGIGYVIGDNDLTAVGTATIFDTTVTTSDREGVSTNDMYYFAGVDIDLYVLQLAAEYGKQLGNSRISARVTIGF